MARLTLSIVNLHVLGLLALGAGCSSGESSTCAPLSEPDAEHSSAEATTDEEEGEECEPGTNCMCPDGTPGTKQCDLDTGELVQCECSKSAMTSTTTAGFSGTAAAAGAGAAGMSAIGAVATAGTAASTAGAGAAGMSASAAAGAGAAGTSASAAAGAGAAGTSASAAGAAGGT